MFLPPFLMESPEGAIFIIVLNLTMISAGLFFTLKKHKKLRSSRNNAV